MKRYLATCVLCLAISLVGFGSMLAGCGQKGDLYLPPPADTNDQQQKKKP